MSKRLTYLCAAAAALTVLFSTGLVGEACTGIRLTAQDGTVVHARTMEFADNLNSQILIVPRGLALQGTAPAGNQGLKWTTKYAATGMNAQGQPILMDGVNEKGLAGGAFYFPGYAQYQEVTKSNQSQAIGAWELVTWLLTNCANIDEVRAGLAGITVGDALPPGWTVAPPAHYIMHDATGRSLVIEYVAGKLNVYDNPLGVITNSPEFPWHVTNLRNYVNLSPDNRGALDIDGLTLQQLGNGSGLLGMPGDFTPPSRFVRASVFARSALPQASAEKTVEEAFHILDGFDITRGDVRGSEDGKTAYELTQWTGASDTRNCVYYFHTYDNRRVRRVDLKRADLNAKSIVTIPLRDTQDIEELTPPTGESQQAKPGVAAR